MEKEQLQQQYARVLLQLETEAKAIATNPPNSNIARSAKQTIMAAGETLVNLSTEWQGQHRISHRDAIIPELFDYAGFVHRG